MRKVLQDRKSLYFILCIILISVLSLTIVYAALSVTLNITGSTEVTASNWNIHLANPEVKSGSVNSSVPTISGNNLSFSVNLVTPGDYYEFTVDVVNDGSIDAMIDSVVKTPELTTEQAKYIKYEVTYENGESISTNQTIKSGARTPIKVRVEYRTDISSSDLPSSTTVLNLKLSLIYVQSDGSGSNILNNGIPNPIVIMSGDGTQVGNEVCIKEECFYVISSTDTTVTMLAKYNLYVGNRIDSYLSAIVAIDNPTGKQDSTATGCNYNNNNVTYPIIGIVSFSDSMYWNDGGLKSEYGTSYPANVYDSNSSLYVYVENYKSYLETLGVFANDARLIYHEELESLGCSGSSCLSAPSWVYSISYWSGSVRNFIQKHTVVFSNGTLDQVAYSDNSNFGVRPVITISRDYL